MCGGGGGGGGGGAEGVWNGGCDRLSVTRVGRRDGAELVGLVLRVCGRWSMRSQCLPMRLVLMLQTQCGG